MTLLLNDHDLDLQHSVAAHLHWNPELDSTRIGVAVEGGMVTLSGTVGSYPELLLATQTAQGVQGVTAVAQELTVHSTWDAADDGDIAREVAEALERAIDVPTSVHAVVRDHFITLSGAVAWQYQRANAERAVSFLRGVKGVFNLVVVVPSVVADDIEAGIEAALLRSSHLDGRHITVTVDNAGIVTLVGTVHSWAERHSAQNLAWSAPGVTGLVDQLRMEATHR